MRRLNTAELREQAGSLSAGEWILLSGTVYTARDAAHKKIFEQLDRGEEPPFPIAGSVIYYAGPTEPRPGAVCGSFGPTTSSRMDRFAPRLLDLGLAAMVGKGERNAAVGESLVKNGGLYLCAIGGAGALAARCITSLEVVAYPELGCESVKKLTFSDFKLLVAMDTRGGNVFLR